MASLYLPCPKRITPLLYQARALGSSLIDRLKHSKASGRLPSLYRDSPLSSHTTLLLGLRFRAWLNEATACLYFPKFLNATPRLFHGLGIEGSALMDLL